MSAMAKSFNHYRDYSQSNETDYLQISRSEENHGLLRVDQRGASKGSEGFPVRLYRMLEHAERDGYTDVIDWQPHGRSFIVHKRKELEENLLPLFFGYSSYLTLQRQLTIYGFRLITTGPDKNSYYHELFLRTKDFLSRSIRRKKIKGRGCRKSNSLGTEPNLYDYPPLPGYNMSKKRETGFTFPAQHQMSINDMQQLISVYGAYAFSPSGNGTETQHPRLQDQHEIQSIVQHMSYMPQQWMSDLQTHVSNNTSVNTSLVTLRSIESFVGISNLQEEYVMPPSDSLASYIMYFPS